MPFESPHIVGDTVEAMEFSHLAQQCSVMGVPRAMINVKRNTLKARSPKRNFSAELWMLLCRKGNEGPQESQWAFRSMHWRNKE